MLLGTSKRNAEELQGPKEAVKLDEKKASEITHLSGIFEPTSDDNCVKDDTSLSVIVEVHSLGEGSASRHQQGKWDERRANAIGQETQSSRPIGGGNYGGKSHVGGRHKKSDQSANEELPNLLPPWKSQILVNRVVKEKAREKVEQEKV